LNEARAVNLNGTKNVIAFVRYARQVGKLKKVAYIGTAYVSGNRCGIIKEDELDCGQRFSNTYEQTKFEAEKVVRTFANDLPITVFRPSIIVGDSKTGMTTSFNVLYAPLKFIDKGFVQIMPGSRKTPLDVVPVDFVCDAICHIFFKTDGCVGQTYHLAAGKKNSLTAGEVIDLAVDYFNRSSERNFIHRVRFVPIWLCRVVKRFLGSRKRRTLEFMEDYAPYIEGERFFDTANTDKALKGTDITPPPYRQYYKTLLGYCLLTKWGKRARSPDNALRSVQIEYQRV
jgi:nucleoside-diphosphate-sugar epimerase